MKLEEFKKKVVSAYEDWTGESIEGHHKEHLQNYLTLLFDLNYDIGQAIDALDEYFGG